MSLFDDLIDDNIAPDYEKVYIYNHFHVWKVGAGLFEACTDVIKGEERAYEAIKRKNNSFVFKLKGREGLWETNYGWALVEDTAKNRKLLDELKGLENMREALQKVISDKYEQLDNLEPKS